MTLERATVRLTKEYAKLQISQPPLISAKPDEDNILNWNYVLTGPPDTPYENGQYYGTLIFKSNYPYSPPAIRMMTPSGRFVVNQRICLSVSDYHPELWQPSWTVETILVGLQSFMTGTDGTTGALITVDATKKKYAANSHKWNSNNNAFRKAFPDLITIKPIHTLPIAGTKLGIIKSQPTLKGVRAKNQVLPTSLNSGRMGTLQPSYPGQETLIMGRKEIDLTDMNSLQIVGQKRKALELVSGPPKGQDNSNLTKRQMPITTISSPVATTIYSKLDSPVDIDEVVILSDGEDDDFALIEVDQATVAHHFKSYEIPKSNSSNSYTIL